MAPALWEHVFTSGGSAGIVAVLFYYVLQRVCATHEEVMRTQRTDLLQTLEQQRKDFLAQLRRCTTPVLLMLVMLAAAAGCNPKAPSPSPVKRDSLPEVEGGIGGALVLNSLAHTEVNQAKPHTDPEGKGILDSAGNTLDAQAGKLRTAAAATAAAEKERGEWSAKYAVAVADFNRLDGRWYVKWGLRIERALWIIGLSWLGIGVVCIFAGLNPLPLLVTATNEIKLLLPFMNVFSWITKAINWARGSPKVST